MDTSAKSSSQELSQMSLAFMEQSSQETSKIKLCECGCGSFVNNRFLRGHQLKLHPLNSKGSKNPRYGIKMSPELKKKISIRIKELGCSKGERNGNFGHHLTEYHKEKLRVCHIGKSHPNIAIATGNRFRGKQSWKKGKSWEEIYKDNPNKLVALRQVLSLKAKEWHKTHENPTKRPEVRQKLIGNKGRLGQLTTLEHRKKLSASLIGKKKIMTSKRTEYYKKRKELGLYKGSNSPNWKGGISREPYSFDFADSLKAKIRIRDNNTCKICGVIENLCIHHINYNKKNSNINNLITVCHKCNSILNFNRNHWTNYLQLVLELGL